MICPIHGFQGAGLGSTTYTLELEYQDPDAVLGNCQVTADLLATETRGYTGADLATVNSNNRNDVNRTYLGTSVSSSYVFDFDTYYYWVEVTMSRNSTCASYETSIAAPTTFFGVRLYKS